MKSTHYQTEDFDTTPDHSADLEAVLLEAGLEYLTEVQAIDSEFE